MSNKTLPFFKFDDFYLDVGERCLLLLRNHGKVVEKEYFLNEVRADAIN